ncbi:MAG: TAXI family TRAP transporter solute-binding subunit [Pseudomonadota bacterium]
MKDALKLYGPIALGVLIVLIITMRVIAPPPPKTVTFAAGGADGQYYAYAEAYRAALSKHGLKVEILETAGTVENFELLLSGKADVGLAQGGLSGLAEQDALLSLGGMFPEPFWIFARAALEADDFGDLRGAALAAGQAGSGTRALTLQLQSDWGGDWAPPVALSGSVAARALLDDEVDAAVFAASVEAGYVQDLLRAEDVTLIPVRRAQALSMRYPALAPKTLYAGVVDMGEGIPRDDVSLVAAIAQLAARDDLHPAIQAVLLEAAEEIHRAPSLLSAGSTYPDVDKIDLPLSAEARRYYRNGPSFLRRYFSFGMANFLERAWVFLIPLITLMIPLVQLAPPVYRWRIRRRIYVWYNDLHELERRGFEAETPAAREQVLDEIQALQHEVGQVDVPVSYNDELYHLRSHINFVEALIARQKAKAV